MSLNIFNFSFVKEKIRERELKKLQLNEENKNVWYGSLLFLFSGPTRADRLLAPPSPLCHGFLSLRCPHGILVSVAGFFFVFCRALPES